MAERDRKKQQLEPFSHQNTAGERDNNDAVLMHDVPVFGALRREFTASLETTHKVKLQIKLGMACLLFPTNCGPLPDEQMWIN